MKRFFLAHPKLTVFGFIFIFVILWTVQSAAFKNVLSLDSVETVCLGAQEQWGNLKHPPLSGWIAYAIARMTGYCDFFQYLASQLCVLGGLVFIYLTARIYLDTRKSLLAVMLTYFLHYYNPSAMVFCPNPLQILLLPAVVYVFLQCVRRGSAWLWCVLSVVSALAFLSKYSTAIVLLTCFVLMLCIRNWRARFASPGPWLSAILFFLLISPHLHWLWKNDFSCLKYVGDSVNDEKNPWFYFIFIFLVGLMPLLVQGVVLLISNYRDVLRLKCFPTAMSQRVGAPENREPILVFGLLVAVPVAVFVLIALTGHHVVATWLSLFAAWSSPLLLVAYPFALNRKTFLLMLALLLVYTAAFHIGQGVDLAVRPRIAIHTDPTELTDAAQEFYGKHAGRDIPCVIGARWYANTLEYYSEDHPVSADIKDPRFVNSVMPKANAEGALLISHYAEDIVTFFQKYRPEIAKGDIRFYCSELTLKCKTVSGAEEEELYYLGYLPPLSPEGNATGK